MQVETLAAADGWQWHTNASTRGLTSLVRHGLGQSAQAVASITPEFIAGCRGFVVLRLFGWGRWSNGQQQAR